MKRIIALLFVLCAWGGVASAQQAGRPRQVSTKPSGACNARDFIAATDTGLWWGCNPLTLLWDPVTNPGGAPAPKDATYITETANSTLTNEFALGSLGTGILKNTTTTGVPSIAVAGDFPTLNQNTSGTAANLSGTPALPNGVTATTQSQSDNSTKLATTAYADTLGATKLNLAGGTLTGDLLFTDALYDIGKSGATRPRDFFASRNGVFGGTINGLTITNNGTNTLNIAAGQTLTVTTGGTLGSAAYTPASAYEVPLTFSTGLTRTINTITVNTSQNIATLSNLTNNGLVTTGGGIGTLSVTVPGTGVLTALGVNVGSAGAFVTFNGAGGTPSSLALANATGLPTTGLTGTLQAAQEPAHTGDITNSAGSLATTLKNTGTAGTYRSVTFDAQGRETSGTNPTTFSGYGLSDTSANFFAAITDETGSGVVVGGTQPQFTTGIGIGVAATTGNSIKATEGTAPSGAASNDLLYPDSTAHRWKVNNNNAGADTMAVFTDKLSVFAATSSAELRGVLSDENGSGVAIFDSSSGATLTSPVIANVAAGSNNFTVTQNSVAQVTFVSSGAAANTLYVSGGQVGINSAGPDSRLYVNGTNAAARIDFAAAGLNYFDASSGTHFRDMSTNERMIIAAAGAITFSSGVTNAAGTPGSLCYNTGTFEMTKNNALTCTVSAREFKSDITPMGSALGVLMRMKPTQFAYKDNPNRLRWGFIADELQVVDSRLGDGYDAKGNAKSIDVPGILSVNTKSIQELYGIIMAQQAEINELKTVHHDR